MKRVGLIFIIILIMIVSMSTVAISASAQGSTAYILHSGVSVYADKTLCEVAKTLEANAQVDVLETITINGEEYYKITADGVEGYVKSIFVYYSGEGTTYEIYTAKAYADKVGGHVDIYSAPYTDAPVLDTFLDGTELAVSESGVNGYHIVMLDNGVGYIKSENITTSISYNQRVALAIGLICAVTVILILVITYYRRNADYFKNRRTSK